MSIEQMTTVDILHMQPRVPEHVVHRQFAEETVVLNLKTGYYHGLNVVGGRMIDALRSAPTVATAAEELAKHFEQPLEVIEADLSEFCQALVERDLLELQLPA